MRLWNNTSIPDYLTKWLLLDLSHMKMRSIVPLVRNFFVANMTLDRLIAKYRPEILSPDYKSKYGPVNNLHILISYSSLSHINWLFSNIITDYDYQNSRSSTTWKNSIFSENIISSLKNLPMIFGCVDWEKECHDCFSTVICNTLSRLQQ